MLSTHTVSPHFNVSEPNQDFSQYDGTRKRFHISASTSMAALFFGCDKPNRASQLLPMPGGGKGRNPE